MKQNKTSFRSSWLAPAALALVLGACSNNQSPAGPSDSTGNFHGKVVRAAAIRPAAKYARMTATTVPVAGIQITVDGAPSGVYTDAEGEFTLTLTPGPHTISISVDGSTSTPLTVTIDGTTNVTLEMELKADGTIVVDEDSNHDGKISKDDDLDHDGDIDDDDTDEDDVNDVNVGTGGVHKDDADDDGDDDHTDTDREGDHADTDGDGDHTDTGGEHSHDS